MMFKQLSRGTGCGALAALGLTLLAASVQAQANLQVDAQVLAAEAARVEVVARASACAVAVFAPDGQGGGSAVVISSDGYALSNFHVTSACGNAMKCGMADGRLYDAVIVGLDPTGDVALIKLLGREDFPAAELGDSDKVHSGDWCFTIGNPFLLATDFKPSVAYGVISGVHRYQYPAGTLLEYADCLQADAAINPGNSGGPLYDAQGKLIGINGRGSFEKRGRVNVGVGYAISINQIKNFLGHLKSGRVVDHATLGARMASDDRQRVLVDDILPSSDAFRRGLRFGDEVLSFAGRTLSTVNGFKNVLGIYPKGWRLPLSYRREGQINDILVRLTGVHREAELAALLAGPAQKPPDDPQPGNREPKPWPKPLPHDPEVPAHKPAAAPMPEIVKQHFIARPGFVNYYFNQLSQQRVWKAVTSHGDFATAAGKWSLSGELAMGADFEFELSDTLSLIKLPGGEAKVDMKAGLSEALAPPGSGGLLAALGLWRRLLVVGPSKFGDLYYLGTAPVPGHEALADVMVGIHNQVEARFYFGRTDGALLEIEMFPDDDEEPCEVYFGEYHEVDGRMLPGRMEVRWGDTAYHVFQLKQFHVETTAEN